MKRRLTDRPCARQPARADAARRADDRPRPAGAPPRVGAALPAEAPGRDAGADDALHGRGRAALRPPRDHGRRAHRRRGVAARADRRSTRRARWSSCASTTDDDAGRRAAARRRDRRHASRRSPTASSCTPTTARPIAERARPTTAWTPSRCSCGAASLEDVFLIAHRPHAGGVMATPLAVRVVERQVQVFRRSVARLGVRPTSSTRCCSSPRSGSGSASSSSRAPAPSAASPTSSSSRPGLMAASAMQRAAGESLWPVMARREVDAARTTRMVATPVAPGRRLPRQLSWTWRASVDVGATVFLRRRRDARRRAVVRGACSRSRPPRSARRASPRR